MPRPIRQFSESSTKRIGSAVRRVEAMPRRESGRAAASPRMRLNAIVPCLVTQTGGSAGNASTACTFTYTVKSLDGDTLLTGASPERPRPALGAMVAQAADSYGAMFWDENGEPVLWDAGEVEGVEEC